MVDHEPHKLGVASSILAPATILLCVWLLTGCATFDKATAGLFHVREEVTTGLAIQPDGTVIEVPLTNKTVVVNPSVTSTISGIKDANGILNPTPSAPLVNLGLTALTAILGMIATYKTKAANENAKALTLTLESIEESQNGEVKAKVDKRSKEVGMSDFIHRRVRKLPKKS